jgi:hypothetical protein
MVHARSFLAHAAAAFLALSLGAASCGDDCLPLETRCDGDRAITCEPTLCTVGPCPTVLVEERCASDERCVLDDDAGYFRAQCVIVGG